MCIAHDDDIGARDWGRKHGRAADNAGDQASGGIRRAHGPKNRLQHARHVQREPGRRVLSYERAHARRQAAAHGRKPKAAAAIQSGRGNVRARRLPRVSREKGHPHLLENAQSRRAAHLCQAPRRAF